MERRRFILNGESFSDLDGFYSAIGRLLAPEAGFSVGHNLDALADILYGGFGGHKPGEPIEIVWQSSEKSRRDLGYEATARALRWRLSVCDPRSREQLINRLAAAESETGDTVFDRIVSVITDTESGYDCRLVLE